MDEGRTLRNTSDTSSAPARFACAGEKLTVIVGTVRFLRITS